MHDLSHLAQADAPKSGAPVSLIVAAGHGAVPDRLTATALVAALLSRGF